MYLYCLNIFLTIRDILFMIWAASTCSYSVEIRSLTYKRGAMCASKNWYLLKNKNIFSKIYSLYIFPVIENTPGDEIHSMFLILSYFIVLCETALTHQRLFAKVRAWCNVFWCDNKNIFCTRFQLRSRMNTHTKKTVSPSKYLSILFRSRLQ